MRQLVPTTIDLADDEVYADVRWGGADEAGIAVGMAIGLDGGVTIGGTSAAIGSAGDKVAFRALRDAADVIVVGGGTVRAESYGPVVRRAQAVARRTSRGQSPVARLAVVSGSLDFSSSERFLRDHDAPPLLVTTTRAPSRLVVRLGEAGATVWQFGSGQVDLKALRSALFANGMRRILCEGGPTLLTAMLAADLVDDIFVTLAPVLTGSAQHLLAPTLPHPVPLELRSVLQADSELLLHYVVVR